MTDSPYDFQISQVELAIQRDPTNNELKKLKENLIELRKLEEVKKPVKNKVSKKAEVLELKVDSKDNNNNKDIILRTWSKGQTVLAKYFKDNEYYEASINDIKDDGNGKILYQVLFKSFSNNSTEFWLKGNEIKDFLVDSFGKEKKSSSSNVEKKRMILEVFKEKKKQKLEEEKYSEGKQKSWQSFKNNKKGGVKVTKKSLPTTPLLLPTDGKLTGYKKREKHIYDLN
ncbi:hypothetical protein HK099_003919 [Clydaea vesicula]|uniref:Tudor domain-containing protein n=1 Tax=Clydaea vesicula TaxID=447962 RepID=A0AAD5U1D1_9FUNG|nr:hypothetical protein HK099_003919 [Clydaea vesicula]KAJ3390151.1 hypothetical protein HDU92_000647 [Lobulomyces angularis]